VLIPCYGDGDALPLVLEQLSTKLQGRVAHVFLVDDGNAPALDFVRLARIPFSFSLTLLSHGVNLGQGAALETARQHALATIPDPELIVVTYDADGQHLPDDALALIAAVEAGADAAIGNRFLGRSNPPLLRRVLLQAARGFEFLLTGRLFGDAHNGLRAFSRKTADCMVIAPARMAHATGMMISLCRMRPRAIIVEVPVSIPYSARSLAKGQRSSAAMLVIVDLLVHALFRPRPSRSLGP
jgi:polyprenyl-phospho-N-acetylgalactosaminyl synthase